MERQAKYYTGLNVNKLKKTTIFLLFCLICSNSFSQEKDNCVEKLSGSSFASLISCGPGNDFYTSFWHSAIRICDPSQKIDIVFNYGTFNFNTPNFYIKFSQGRLKYMLSVENFEDFLYEYKREGRSVIEQKLSISQEEINRLFLSLINNYNINRYYAYDFFIDNCATRVRDQIEHCLINRSFYPMGYEDNPLTFRELLHPYMDKKLEWWKLGIDIVLGARCDKKTSIYKYMFLPEILKKITADSLIKESGEHLAISSVEIIPETKSELKDSISPMLIFCLIFAFYTCISIGEFVKKRYNSLMKISDILLYISASIVSIVIIYLWFFSNHYCTKWNLNLLWANPLFLCMIFCIRKKSKIISKIIFICLISSLIFSMTGFPQQFNPALIPIILTLIIRVLNHIIRNSAKET